MPQPFPSAWAEDEAMEDETPRAAIAAAEDDDAAEESAGAAMAAAEGSGGWG